MGYLFKQVNRLVGKVVHQYSLLEQGDTILVALSGGVDSMLTLWFLKHWLRKAPISYRLLPVHLDMGFSYSLWPGIKEYLDCMEVDYYFEQTDFGIVAHSDLNRGKSPCFLCSLWRRKRLFELADRFGCNKIALGHNLDDLIETFFMNMCFSGELSTMVPSQEMFKGAITIIRPLALVEKKKISALARQIKLPLQDNPCPSVRNKYGRRVLVRDFLSTLYSKDSKIKGNIVHALRNIKLEYMLKYYN